MCGLLWYIRMKQGLTVEKCVSLCLTMYGLVAIKLKGKQ